ncbi:MAG: hypothetical protein M3R00_03940 [Pseudomonadota bacterium]|nr:hypothetical protein [Pseudomonadota bacterium]
MIEELELSIEDEKKFNALNEICENGSIENAKLLLSYGATITALSIEIAKKNNTPDFVKFIEHEYILSEPSPKALQS